jgi:hypothetical protein
MRSATKLRWSCTCGASDVIDIPIETEPIEVAPVTCPSCSEALPAFALVWEEVEE